MHEGKELGHLRKQLISQAPELRLRNNKLMSGQEIPKGLGLKIVWRSAKIKAYIDINLI